MKVSKILINKRIALSSSDKSGRKFASVSGFTIVELLVVIVVIGILAAIIIVSYTGITKKANEASIQTEITNASKKLSMYYAEYGSYPTEAGFRQGTNWCPTEPYNDTNYCIKFNPDIVAEYISLTTLSYTLKFTRNNLSYSISSGGSIVAEISATPITAISAITGTTQVGQTLTVGTLTPAAATGSYQWQSATTADGAYSDISGATSSTYVLALAQVGKYIKVKATGINPYSGTQTSAATTIVTDPNWLTIGTQTWAKYNLNVGTMINGSVSQTNNAVLEKYCYGNNEASCTANGGFYQWNEAMQYSTIEGSQGICPVNSHIPSDNDWKILEIQLGMTQAAADATGWRGTDQSIQLKPGGSSGLNIPLAGVRDSGGSLVGLASYTFLWSSSESSVNAWRRYMSASAPSSTVARNIDSKTFGFSVRCLMN